MSPPSTTTPDEDDELFPELPAQSGEAGEEEPFEPEDDADFEMHLDEREQLSAEDLEAGLGDADPDNEVGHDGEDEDWASGGEADDDSDLHDDDGLLAGEEEGWLEGGEPPEDSDQFDEDGLGAFEAEDSGADDGEDGFDDEDHGAGVGSGPLPPLTGGADDEEGFDDVGTAALSVALVEEEDEDPDGADLEMWPGIRFRFVAGDRVSALQEVREPMASGYYAADGERLYALRDGSLCRLSPTGWRALEVQPERAHWVALAAGGGSLWGASTDAVFHAAAEGEQFSEVYRTASLNPAVPQLQATTDGSAWLCRGQRVYRIAFGQAGATPLETDRPVALWAAGGERSIVVQGASGPILWSQNGGRRFSELPLPVDGLSDLWVTDGLVAVATTQGVLASTGGDWMQLLPPSTTLCDLALGPDGPQVFGCAAHPGGWALVTRPCTACACSSSKSRR